MDLIVLILSNAWIHSKSNLSNWKLCRLRRRQYIVRMSRSPTNSAQAGDSRVPPRWFWDHPSHRNKVEACVIVIKSGNTQRPIGEFIRVNFVDFGINATEIDFESTMMHSMFLWPSPHEIHLIVLHIHSFDLMMASTGICEAFLLSTHDLEISTFGFADLIISRVEEQNCIHLAPFHNTNKSHELNYLVIFL
jgi:hypothetical protein